MMWSFTNHQTLQECLGATEVIVKQSSDGWSISVVEISKDWRSLGQCQDQILHYHIGVNNHGFYHLLFQEFQLH